MHEDQLYVLHPVRSIISGANFFLSYHNYAEFYGFILKTAS
jgi:hypothetical protein